MKAYLAGPDVFLPNATEHARRKVTICARLGFTGRPPLNEDVEALAALPDEQAWETIFRKDVGMMEECDVILANLTPFRGVSADSGTLIEVGWFLGRGKPVFAYSNNGIPFARRCAAHNAVLPDPIPGVSVEGFGLPDNLMIAGAVLHGGGGFPMVVPDDGRELPMDSLEMFERCAALVSERLR